MVHIYAKLLCHQQLQFWHLNAIFTRLADEPMAEKYTSFSKLPKNTQTQLFGLRFIIASAGSQIGCEVCHKP